MDIIFTRNSSPVSRLIRHITDEPVSHCALLDRGVVVHMNFRGLQVQPLYQFIEKHEVCYTVSVSTAATLPDILTVHWKSRYDFGALLYLGLRTACPLLPKANLWQTSGLFLCTEFVTDVLTGEEDHLITPYKLYLRLVEMQAKGK